MKEKITLNYTTTTEPPQVLRNMGYTKNHLALRVHVACAWRLMGYYTQKQIDGGVWHADVKRRIEINTGGRLRSEDVSFKHYTGDVFIPQP